ncbi:MAG TPA: Calx-beta domain-containing protein, partial [Solirubrobacter sp.]|nr:Calx-beta domain-containing protein [Solirubrobacter sp.]
SGVQAGGRLHRVVELGLSAFNFGPTDVDPDPEYSSPVDGHASGEVFSSANGARYSVAAQAPVLDLNRADSSKGGVTHLDESQAYEKRSGDASLRITVTHAVLHAVDASHKRASECPGLPCSSIRSVVRFRARAYAASAGGDFFNVGGIAVVHGHYAAWHEDIATFADSSAPLWHRDDFQVGCEDFFCDLDVEGWMRLHGARTLRVPLASVRTGELFGVHVSLEAETVDDRGVESAALAYIRDPQERGPALLRAHGLTARGKPAFKEPPVRGPRPARCPAGPARRAGRLQLSARAFAADESDRDPMILVTRSGGSHGAATVAVRTAGDSATAGADFTRRITRVRFPAGDRTPRLVEIPIREDSMPESPESFTVSLADPRCAKLGKRRTAAVTLLDDDQPPVPPPPPASTVDGPEGSDPVPVTGGSVPPVEAIPAPAGLDTTFGSNGRATTPGEGDGEAVLIQRDGHIVTVGPREADNNFHFDFGATRHDPTGHLDSGFGTDGIAMTDLGGNDDKAFDAVQLPDGGFVAVGQADPGGLANTDFGVVRYTADGHPDRAFDTDGIVTSDLTGRDDVANAVAVQPDGKIVAAGFAEITPFNFAFALARYNPDGTLDPSFGGDGIVTTDLGTGNDGITDLALQPDGKIVAVGATQEAAALARYLPDGTLDPSFGAAGIAIGALNTNLVTGIAIAPGGTILVAGTRGGPNGLDPFVAGYTPDGRPDAGFGQSGVAQVDLSGGLDFGEDLALDAHGNIVVVGSAASSTVSDMALVRLTPDGILDRSFAGRGFLTADFRGFGDTGHAVAIDAQGRIVAAGSGAGEFALMRANP